MNRIFTKIGIGAPGLATGTLIVIALISSLQHQKHKSASPPDPESTALPGLSDTSDLEARLQRLEQRAAPVPTAATASAAPSASGQGTPAPVATQSPEEARARWAARGAERAAQVAAEPRDAAWSRKAMDTFAKEFKQLGAMGHFTVSELDCKTTSCMAKLRWDSYSDAANGWRSVMHAAYKTTCSREVFAPLPNPEDADKPYTGSVYFDCTDDRAESAAR
jgi:hypothetical protein